MNYTQPNFLIGYLNRNLINYQVEEQSNKETSVIMEKIVWFVVEVYKIINEYIIKSGSVEYVLSIYILGSFI